MNSNPYNGSGMPKVETSKPPMGDQNVKDTVHGNTVNGNTNPK